MKPIIYQWINDKFPERTIQEKVSIFKDLGIDTIHRAFWYCPELHCPKIDTSAHYHTNEEWLEMQNVVTKLHDAMPNLKIIAGAGPRINRTNIKNYETGTIYDSSTSITPWDMYLDPSKWGISSPTKDEAASILTSAGSGDLTNPTFYQIQLSRFEKFIDIGCDGVWHDWLYWQAKHLYRWTNYNINHPAVIESYNASTNMISDIRDYFISKSKEPLVGSWIPPTYYPSNLPNLDFLTETFIQDCSEMIGNIDYVSWDSKVSAIRQYYPNKQIFVFIDDPPILSCFAQCLTQEQQKSKLKEIHKLCKDKGLTPAYPVHGQWIWTRPSCSILPLRKSYDIYNYYDSLAPEFNTYQTIKELMNPSSNLFPILLGGGLLGLILLGNKGKKKKISSTRHDDFVS